MRPRETTRVRAIGGFRCPRSLSGEMSAKEPSVSACPLRREQDRQAATRTAQTIPAIPDREVKEARTPYLCRFIASNRRARPIT